MVKVFQTKTNTVGKKNILLNAVTCSVLVPVSTMKSGLSREVCVFRENISISGYYTLHYNRKTLRLQGGLLLHQSSLTNYKKICFVNLKCLFFSVKG